MIQRKHTSAIHLRQPRRDSRSMSSLRVAAASESDAKSRELRGLRLYLLSDTNGSFYTAEVESADLGST